MKNIFFSDQKTHIFCVDATSCIIYKNDRQIHDTTAHYSLGNFIQLALGVIQNNLTAAYTELFKLLKGILETKLNSKESYHLVLI